MRQSETSFASLNGMPSKCRVGRPAPAYKSASFSPYLSIMAALALSTSVAGCSISRTAALEQEPEVITSSITKPIKAEGIDSTDAELIKTVVAGAEDSSLESNMLAWSNPDTGNHGTIMAIDRFVGSHGQSCKKFQTTVDSFTGISVYNGEACEMEKGSWVLSWFTRD